MTSLSQNNAALCRYFWEEGCATLQRDDISKNAAVVTHYAVNFAISTAPVPMTTLLLYLLLAKPHFLSLFKSEIDLWWCSIFKIIDWARRPLIIFKKFILTESFNILHLLFCDSGREDRIAGCPLLGCLWFSQSFTDCCCRLLESCSLAAQASHSHTKDRAAADTLSVLTQTNLYIAVWKIYLPTNTRRNIIAVTYLTWGVNNTLPLNYTTCAFTKCISDKY